MKLVVHIALMLVAGLIFAPMALTLGRFKLFRRWLVKCDDRCNAIKAWCTR